MIYDPYSKNMNCRVFDIETTGLSPAMDMIISASFIDPDGSGLTQYFTEDPASEYITVTRILEELSGCDAVITYNGNSFDLPFIYSRARKLCITGPRHFLRKIDIYRWLKSYWQLAPSMESLRQVAVEEALGLSECRTDRINGGECIPLYSDYLSRGTEKSKELILLHNADDVRQLAAITQKLSFLPYHRIAFENGFMTKANSFGLFGNCEYRILGGPAELKGGHLKLKARIDPPCMPTAYYEDGFRLQSDGTVDQANAVGLTGEAYLSIPASREGEGKVNVVIQEKMTECAAVTDETEPIPTGERITVIGLTREKQLLVMRNEIF